MRNVLVDVLLGGDDRILGIALLDKGQVGPIKATVMASVKDIVAEVRRVTCNVLKTLIRSVAREEACPFATSGFHNKASIMQHPFRRRRGALWRPKHPKSDAVCRPPRLIPIALTKRSVRFGPSVFKVSHVIIEVVPFLGRYA